jgi:hypothetical protein
MLRPQVLLQHNRDMLAAADRPGQGGNGAEHTTAAEVRDNQQPLIWSFDAQDGQAFAVIHY